MPRGFFQVIFPTLFPSLGVLRFFLVLGAFADPFGGIAGLARGGVVFHASGDGFGFGILFELHDQPLTSFDGGQDEAGVGFLDCQFLGFLPGAAGSCQRLVRQRDWFHVFIEHGDVKLSVFDGDFAMHRFIFAEFQDTTALGAEFDAAVAEGEAGGKHECEGESGECCFHNMRMLGLG